MLHELHAMTITGKNKHQQMCLDISAKPQQAASTTASHSPPREPRALLKAMATPKLLCLRESVL